MRLAGVPDVRLGAASRSNRALLSARPRAHAEPSSRRVAARLLRAQHDLLDLVRGASDELLNLLCALAKAPEHVRRDDLRVARVRPPDADTHAREVGAAELALDRLQSVVPRKATPRAYTHLAERQVDL